MKNQNDHLSAYIERITQSIRNTGLDPDAIQKKGDNFTKWSIEFDNGFNVDMTIMYPGDGKSPLFKVDSRLCIVDAEIGSAMVHTLTNQHVLPLQFKYMMWFSKDDGYNTGIMSLRATWAINDFDVRYLIAHIDALGELPQACLRSFSQFKHRPFFAA